MDLGAAMGPTAVGSGRGGSELHHREPLPTCKKNLFLCLPDSPVLLSEPLYFPSTLAPSTSPPPSPVVGAEAGQRRPRCRFLSQPPPPFPALPRTCCHGSGCRHGPDGRRIWAWWVRASPPGAVTDVQEEPLPLPPRQPCPPLRLACGTYANEVSPVVVNESSSMFYGTTTSSGAKCFDSVYFLMIPQARVLRPLPGACAHSRPDQQFPNVFIRETGARCYMLSARELFIVWATCRSTGAGSLSQTLGYTFGHTLDPYVIISSALGAHTCHGYWVQPFGNGCMSFIQPVRLTV